VVFAFRVEHCTLVLPRLPAEWSPRGACGQPAENHWA
jgi:hypothetical protein